MGVIEAWQIIRMCLALYIVHEDLTLLKMASTPYITYSQLSA